MLGEDLWGPIAYCELQLDLCVACALLACVCTFAGLAMLTFLMLGQVARTVYPVAAAIIQRLRVYSSG